MKKLVKKVATSALAATLVLPAGLAGAATKFPDVNPNTVTPDVQQAIEALAEQGIIQGFPDGTFGPNKSITRAQFAKILAQVKGLKPNPAAAAQFTDVKDPEQQGWVGALVEAGLTTGTTPSTYSPNRPIQRDQAATFLVRALGLEEVAQELNLTPTTTDGARINASHKANVGLLEKIGLVKGYPNGAYGPGDPFKRQQAANLLYKVQQEGDTYVSAAQALLNKVEVIYNDNGTVTVKGTFKNAATVDVVVREAETATTQAPGDVLFEQKGVEVKDGAFEVTTSFIGNKAVTVSVTAYDAEGNVISTLEQKAQPSQDGEVQGYTDAPDLIHAYSDGKYVYFVFDEPINKILDEDAFKVFTFGGGQVEAKDVRLESDKVTVRADFYNAGIPAISTVAYVEEGAVNDEDRNESIEGIVPLNNVDLTKGATAGPDLVSVRISSFSLNAPELEDDSSNPGQKVVVTEGTKDFTVEYKFDEKISEVDTSKPESFVLFLKDGTMLAGTDIVNEKSDTVEVKFNVEYSANLDATKTNIDEYVIVSGVSGGVESKLSKRYAGKAIDRDAIALAAVLPGTVKDDDSTPRNDKSPNPLTVTKARASLSANYLRSVDVDLKNAKLTYKFDRSVEGLDAFSNTDLGGKTKAQLTVEEYFGVYTISGDSEEFKTRLSTHIKKVTVDNKSVTVELDKKEAEVASALASVVGAYVLPVDDIDVNSDSSIDPNDDVVGTLGANEEQDRVIGGAAPISRSYKAGENFAPMLKKYEASYDEDDELLTLTLVFTQDIDKVNEDEIVFFNANGEKVDADVTVDDIKHDEVVLEIEIDADDYEEIVAFALKHGFAESGADGYVGTPSVPAVMPY